MPEHDYGYSFLGVNYSDPPHELRKGFIPHSQNVLPNASGFLTGRKGSVALNSTTLSNRITSFFEFRSGSTRQKLTSYSTKIAYYNSASGDFVDLHSGLTSNKMLQWANFAGKAICVNDGNDAPQYYASISDYGALAGSPPTGKTITDWANRIWFGGDATQPARLTGSTLNDPTDYTGAAATATDAIQTYVGDTGDPITAIFGFFDILLIGKRNNIYKMSGSPATDATSLSVEPLYSKSTDNVGFTSPWAITQVGNDIIFLDGFDIKRLSGIQEFGDVEYISIIPQFRDYLKSIADKDYLQYTQFFHYKQNQQIWISIPTGASTNYVFVLDYKFYADTEKYAFYPMADLDINCFGGIENGEVTDIYYGDESGFVHQLDTGNDDNGGAIDRQLVTVVSGNFPEQGVLQNHERRKGFLRTRASIEPEQSSLTMTPYYALDLFNSEQVRDDDNYTSLANETITGDTWIGNGAKQKKVPFFGLSGNTLALKWQHNTLNENFIFYPSEVEYQWKSKNLIV